MRDLHAMRASAFCVTTHCLQQARNRVCTPEPRRLTSLTVRRLSKPAADAPPSCARSWPAAADQYAACVAPCPASEAPRTRAPCQRARRRTGSTFFCAAASGLCCAEEDATEQWRHRCGWGVASVSVPMFAGDSDGLSPGADEASLVSAITSARLRARGLIASVAFLLAKASRTSRI
jgi:hypothetical protein